jgi:hypothetical protein
MVHHMLVLCRNLLKRYVCDALESEWERERVWNETDMNRFVDGFMVMFCHNFEIDFMTTRGILINLNDIKMHHKFHNPFKISLSKYLFYYAQQ